MPPRLGGKKDCPWKTRGVKIKRKKMREGERETRNIGTIQHLAKRRMGKIYDADCEVSNCDRYNRYNIIANNSNVTKKWGKSSRCHREA